MQAPRGAAFRRGSASLGNVYTRWDPLLAAWSGASLAGVVVHFTLWPWRHNKLGIPVLTEAEGLSSSSLPAYNALLYAWAAASALSIIREVRPGARRWALAGLATEPLLRRSAQHHFSWLKQEAIMNPAWWNRGASLHSKRGAEWRVIMAVAQQEVSLLGAGLGLRGDHRHRRRACPHVGRRMNGAVP